MTAIKALDHLTPSDAPLAGSSFAGIHETKLSVASDKLPEMIKACLGLDQLAASYCL